MVLQLPETIAETARDFTGRTWILPRIVDWLDQTQNRILLIVGAPGSGKSMVAAWIGGAGSPPADPHARALLDKIRTSACAAHFCQATSGNSPKAFAKNIATQVARVVDRFAEHVVASVSDRARIVNIDAALNVQTAHSGAKITNVELHLDLGSLTDEPSFQRVLVEPLTELYEAGYRERMLIIVDALDEALLYTGVPNIVQMLNRLGDLPRQCRFIATTRPDSRVLEAIDGATPLMLDEDPEAEAAIREYSRARLRHTDEPRRTRLATRIAQAAAGQFLYARLLLDEIAAKLAGDFDPEIIPLPTGLSGFYQSVLHRELKADPTRWFQSVRPVLGLVAVAQGSGLDRSQIKRVAKIDVAQPLALLEQYVQKPGPDGPFKLFHYTLTEFLIGKNHIDGPAMHLAIAEYYHSQRNGFPAWKKWDSYGLLYTATHLAEASRTGDPEDADRVQKLVDLVFDPGYQKEHDEKGRDIEALKLDLDRAMRSAAGCDYERAVPLLIRAALGVVSYRNEQLRPEPIFELARKGNTVEAVNRVDLFGLDANWRHALRLIIAWLAAGSDPEAATKLRLSVFPRNADSTLLTLMQRLDTALGRGTMPALTPLPAVEDEFSTQQRVRNMVAEYSGTTRNSRSVSLSRYRRLGPHLVASALQPPYAGDRFLREYIGVHTNYQYVLYRQASLWVLL